MSTRYECTSADGCGPEMECCVAIGFGGSTCALGCDIGVQNVVCDADSDCQAYSLSGAGVCSRAGAGVFGLRTCGSAP